MLNPRKFKSELDIENEKINYKIRQHSLNKIPVIIVVGKNEVQKRTISIRQLDSKGTLSIDLNSMSEFFRGLEQKSKSF